MTRPSTGLFWPRFTRSKANKLSPSELLVSRRIRKVTRNYSLKSRGILIRSKISSKMPSSSSWSMAKSEKDPESRAPTVRNSKWSWPTRAPKTQPRRCKLSLAPLCSKPTNRRTSTWTSTTSTQNRTKSMLVESRRISVKQLSERPLKFSEKSPRFPLVRARFLLTVSQLSSAMPISNLLNNAGMISKWPWPATHNSPRSPTCSFPSLTSQSSWMWNRKNHSWRWRKSNKTRPPSLPDLIISCPWADTSDPLPPNPWSWASSDPCPWCSQASPWCNLESCPTPTWST